MQRFRTIRTPSPPDSGWPSALQEGRPPLFQQDGGAMLIAIVLDRPLQEAQTLVDQPLQFLQEIKRVLDDQKEHPILERMLRTI